MPLHLFSANGYNDVVDRAGNASLYHIDLQLGD